MKKQVLVLNNPGQFDRADEQASVGLNDTVDIDWRHVTAEQTLSAGFLDSCPSPDILVTALITLEQALLQQMPELEAIIAASTATDYIDLDYCRECNIKVFNTPGYTGPSVAEHAFALVMAASKHLREADASLRTQPVIKVRSAMELHGKCLGIIGLGAIGAQVANYASCFGMEVVYCNRSKKAFAGATQLESEALLKCSDIVVMTVPLNRDSHHMIGQRELELMKPSAFLVNIGADELIVISDLVEALKTKKIAGAALDVISEYNEYLEAPNLILTQSRGWYTRQSIDRRMEGWMSILSGYLNGEYINRIV